MSRDFRGDFSKIGKKYYKGSCSTENTFRTGYRHKDPEQQ
jgi:hypothetical protein